MWRLNVGANKKVGRSNYGSQGAAVTLEAEATGDVLQDPEILRRRARAQCTGGHVAPDRAAPGRSLSAVWWLLQPWRTYVA